MSLTLVIHTCFFGERVELQKIVYINLYLRDKSLSFLFLNLTFMTLSSQIAMPHQWLEGNLPVSAKCAVCDKTCGSVLRLQDWKCLWCKAMVGAMNHVQASRILPAVLLTAIFVLSFHNCDFGLSRSRQLVQTPISLTFIISHDCHTDFS